MPDHKEDPILGPSKRIESLLRQLGGQGHGMQQLAKSLDNKLDAKLSAQIRSLNRRRNEYAHEEDVQIDPELFRSDALVIIAKLEAMLNQPSAKLNLEKPDKSLDVAGSLVVIGIEAALALRSYLRGFK